MQLQSPILISPAGQQCPCLKKKKKSEDKQADTAPNVGGKSTIGVHHVNIASKQEVDRRMTIRNAAGEEYSSVHRARFMSGVCFIAPPSEDADAPSRNLLRRGLTSWYLPVFMGHQYGSQVMNYSWTSQVQRPVKHLHLSSSRQEKKETPHAEGPLNLFLLPTRDSSWQL